MPRTNIRTEEFEALTNFVVEFRLNTDKGFDELPHTTWYDSVGPIFIVNYAAAGASAKPKALPIFEAELQQALEAHVASSEALNGIGINVVAGFARRGPRR